jgi:hypothetical protein
MTANLDTFIKSVDDCIKKMQYFEEHPEVQISGRSLPRMDGNTVIHGKKKVNDVVVETGVYWNGRLIIPSSLIPEGSYVPLENIGSVTDEKGFRWEGEFYDKKLVRGTLTPNQPHYPYSYHGRFDHKTVKGKIISQCVGVKTYAISGYREEDTFYFGLQTETVTKTDQLGRVISGRLMIKGDRFDGVFTYSPQGTNILCEGIKTGPEGKYKAPGVFINGIQLKGILIHTKDPEEAVPDQIKGNEDMLKNFMAQDLIHNFRKFCRKQRAIPPFRLFLEES